MKKIVYTSLICLLLLGSLTAVASAATNTLIGKKVQAVLAVTVDGKAVKDAVVIDGVTYAPVRSFSEAAGYSLDIKGGAVNLTTHEEQVVSEIKVNYRIQTLTSLIKQYELSISTNNEIIKDAQANIDRLTELSKTNDMPFLDLTSETKKVEDLKAEIAELQKQIDAANAEIAQLQEQLK